LSHSARSIRHLIDGTKGRDVTATETITYGGNTAFSGGVAIAAPVSCAPRPARRTLEATP